MSKNFEAKKVVVSEIEEKIEKAESIVIVEYKGLTVEAITALRVSASMPDFLLISTIVAFLIMILPMGVFSILNFSLIFGNSSFSQGY